MEKIVTFADVRKGDIVCKELADIEAANYYRVRSVGRYSRDKGDFISLSLSFKNSQRTYGYNDVPDRRIVLVHRPLPEGKTPQHLLWDLLGATRAVLESQPGPEMVSLLAKLRDAIDAPELSEPFNPAPGKPLDSAQAKPVEDAAEKTEAQKDDDCRRGLCKHPKNFASECVIWGMNNPSQREC